jgi:CO dehydrogenase/acetyl-CoA synthase alpha subunit
MELCSYKWMTYGEASTNRTAIGSGLIYHGIPEVSHNGRNKYRPSFFN